MIDIRVTCQNCRAVALLSPAQVLLLADPDRAWGDYLFLCPTCGCVTAKSAGGEELQVLLLAGVADAREASRPDRARPAAASGAPPLTRDDLLDFHLLLAEDDWFSQLA